jgi:hypothetical protein
MTMEISLFWVIGSAVLTAGIAWGVCKSQLKDLAEEVAVLRTNYSRDHDLLVEIRTKLDMIVGTLKKVGCK